MNSDDIKKAILSAPLKTETVKVPEWGITVTVKTMSGNDRLVWADQAYDDKGLIEEHYRGRMLVHCLVDEKGQRIFGDADAADLEGKHGVVITNLFAVASRLNSPLPVDEAEKN